MKDIISGAVIEPHQRNTKNKMSECYNMVTMMI